MDRTALAGYDPCIDVERYGVFGQEDPSNLGRFGFTGPPAGLPGRLV